ncbi:HtaA domain-containing protein [Leucobacter sp. CSA1]|uniref:HtaA domain-containing protein n=1 Tax=Leucobacter chromiisoli TaxID=2796471 RepID=A0A934Q5E7_9MICO|nr:HtaA domain-containing protein [Leucobacter chromiisoli]
MLGAAILGGGLLLAPATAQAAPLVAEETTSADCTVTSSELRWGVKESFRSYISGSIANGEWTTDNGAGYETPEFIWSTDAGELSSDLESGTISFTGGVHFTGHGGALAMDLANPSIQFEGDAAYLLLDFGATDTAQEGAPASSQLRAAKIELGEALSTEGDALTISGATTRLTSEGAAAFNGDYGDYAAGDEMDPVSLTAAVSGCELGAVEIAAPAEPDEEEPAPAPAEPVAQQQVPWIPIIVGGVAILVIGVTAGMLIAGRGKGKSAGAGAPDGAAASQDPEQTPGG